MNPLRFTAEIAGASYDGLVVVNAVELGVTLGGVLAILGANGAGKSTTLRSIVDEVKTRHRRVQLGDRNLSSAPSWKLVREGIASVPDGARCFANLTVAENLAGPGGALKLSRAVAAERTAVIYELFPVLAGRQGQLAGTLSGGERQMLAVGRALMGDPKVLILDEPSAGLAPVVVEQLFAALAAIKTTGRCAMVIAEQNAAVAATVADYGLVLEQGRVVLQGAFDTVLGDNRLSQAYLGL